MIEEKELNESKYADGDFENDVGVDITYDPTSENDKPSREIPASDNDSWSALNYNLPSSLYHYYLSDNPLIGNTLHNTNGSWLGHCPAILSIQYTPFIDMFDLNLTSIGYDVDRFGKVSDYHTPLEVRPTVFRINNLAVKTKKLGHFNAYHKAIKPRVGKGQKRNWRNEHRLYLAPYSFGVITDHLNPPMHIHWHLCRYYKNDLWVRNTISNACKYGLWVYGYKNDFEGNMEAQISTGATELPCSSSQYNQWYANNKNQAKAQIDAISKTAFIQNQTASGMASYTVGINNAQQKAQLWGGMANGVIGGGLSGLMGGGIGGALVGAGMGALSPLINYEANKNVVGLQNAQAQYQSQMANKMNNAQVHNAVAMQLAQKQDLDSTPRSMVSMGSDIFYGLYSGKKEVTMYKFFIDSSYAEKIGDYLHMFGNSAKELFIPDLRNRYYFNYVKTADVNLYAYRNIQKDHMEVLKSIYNNGVRIWHVDRPEVNIRDYTYDNFEYYERGNR